MLRRSEPRNKTLRGRSSTASRMASTDKARVRLPFTSITSSPGRKPASSAQDPGVTAPTRSGWSGNELNVTPSSPMSRPATCDIPRSLPPLHRPLEAIEAPAVLLQPVQAAGTTAASWPTVGEGGCSSIIGVAWVEDGPERPGRKLGWARPGMLLLRTACLPAVADVWTTATASVAVAARRLLLARALEHALSPAALSLERRRRTHTACIMMPGRPGA
mmetsp:Transcript_52967/g.113575  ORF Transcript_52967/g.113575 Transcript_52967/m.113575 type:complete len:218 (+) Transcript_52967:1145-1798(+)